MRYLLLMLAGAVLSINSLFLKNFTESGVIPRGVPTILANSPVQVLQVQSVCLRQSGEEDENVGVNDVLSWIFLSGVFYY